MAVLLFLAIDKRIQIIAALTASFLNNQTTSKLRSIVISELNCRELLKDGWSTNYSS